MEIQDALHVSKAYSCTKVKLVVEKKFHLKKKVKAKYPKPFPFAHLVIYLAHVQHHRCVECLECIIWSEWSFYGSGNCGYHLSSNGFREYLSPSSFYHWTWKLESSMYHYTVSVPPTLFICFADVTCLNLIGSFCHC